jgi:release factor glutamine methyltransferase
MIHYFNADWLTALNQKTSAFDMIVCNPPYIPSRVLEGLQPEIRGFEPITALDGNNDGLGCFKKIIGSAHCYLKPGGVLLLEIGYDQQDDVRRTVSDSGHYDDFSCTKDYAGHDRVVLMRRKS